VTLGFRETYETKFESVWRPQPIDTTTGTAKAGLASDKASPVNVGIDNAAPSFLISSDYHLSPSSMIYALVSQGEKAGGLNATLPATGLTADSLKVKPETATDYEAGFKGDYWGRRLSVDLSLFYTTVRNYQATYITTVDNATAQYLANVGRVRTQGAEAEITARPITGLTLHASAAFDDATYASYVNAPCAAEVTGKTYCNLTGRPVAGAPKWTLGLNGGYERPLTNDLVGYVQGEYSWRSHFYGYLDDSTYSRTGDYALVNLRLGVRLASGRWDLALWGKNVFDQHYVANYLSYGTLLPGVYVPFFGDPATYGVTLRTQF
jgi:iron complex outermembrane receptor protein